jgi:hypothetical protein
MSMKDPQFRDAMEDSRRREEYDREEAARKRNMASERPICEHHWSTGYRHFNGHNLHYCVHCGEPLIDSPAPAETTPERAAVDVEERQRMIDRAWDFFVAKYGEPKNDNQIANTDSYATEMADFALSLRADPPPDVIRRIEEEFAGRVKARIIEQMGVTSAFYDRAMEAALGREG